MQRKVEWMLPLALLQAAGRPLSVPELVVRIQETRKALGIEPHDFHHIGLHLRPILYRLKKLGLVNREGVVIEANVDFRSAPWSISELGTQELQKILDEMAEVKRLAES